MSERDSTSTTVAESKSVDQDNNSSKQDLARRASASNLSSLRAKSSVAVMNAFTVLELKQSVNKHHDDVGKLLMLSKESLERKTQIESALRVCKKAFLICRPNT